MNKLLKNDKILLHNNNCHGIFRQKLTLTGDAAMDNLAKIKKFSKFFQTFISFLLVVIPLYYAFYWSFINYLPATPITVNMEPASLIPHKLPAILQITGFLMSLLPLSALIYGLFNIRKLFSFYREGMIFSLAHVDIFKNTAKALMLWVVLSIMYESVKSVLFSVGNPPGARMLHIGFSSPEITVLLVGAIIFVIARVMDEGRRLAEENQLTI